MTCTPPPGGSIATDITTPATNNRIASTNANGVAWAPGYDNAGDILSDGRNTYLYDGEGRICAMQTPSMTGGGATMVQYIYNADGVRVAKGSISSWSCDVRSNGFTATNSYAIGPSGEQITETDGSNNWVHTNANVPGGILATYDPSGLHFQISDWLGSRRVQTNYAGVPEMYFGNLPFGDQLTETAATNCTASIYCFSEDSTEHHFTGKERDAESGLDYFGARYYTSNMGRWMSPDPKAPSAKTLMNPQKWNMYNYVLNNPLAMYDPDGQEEKTIVYRTFIAAQSVTAGGKTYAGDNRTFSTAPNASSRSTITVTIETDPSIRPGNPIISTTGTVTGSAGQTKQLDSQGNVVNSATATAGLPVATGSRDANGNAIINIGQDVKNPLSPLDSVFGNTVGQALTPGISANLTMTFTPNGAGITTTGTASNFPSQELNVTGANGSTTPIFQFSPPATASPFSLYLPDRKVNCTGACTP